MKIQPWCFGKTCYASKAEAIRRIERQTKDKRRRKQRGWSGDQVLHPYQCTTCGHWHVGGTSKRQMGHTDQRGRVVHKHQCQPKEVKDGGQSGSGQAGETHLPTVRADAEAQAGQVTERQPGT